MVYRTYELIRHISQVGVTYKTAYRWWKDGKLDAYQSHTGTIIVREQPDWPTGVALYARVSSAAQKEDALRQMQRLRDYDAAKGYQLETIFPSDTGDDLVDDFVAVITSMAARSLCQTGDRAVHGCAR